MSFTDAAQEQIVQMYKLDNDRSAAFGQIKHQNQSLVPLTAQLADVPRWSQGHNSVTRTITVNLHYSQP